MRPILLLLLLAAVALFATETRVHEIDEPRRTSIAVPVPSPPDTTPILSDSVFASNGRLIAFIRTMRRVGYRNVAESASMELVLPHTDGSERVISADSLEWAAWDAGEYAGLDSPVLSLDERTLFVGGPYRVTAGGAYAVDLKTGVVRFVAWANTIEIVPSGKYRGMLMVHRLERHGETGKVEVFHVVDPQTGLEVASMPYDADPTTWRRQFGL
jgi:hypothetical protein